jgi:plastocyanin
MYFSKSAVLAFISAASAANFNVLVGQNGQLTFTPQTVQAAVGDTVTYTFLTQNHTVTSGTPGQGCAPDGTFNSGFIPIPSAGAAAAAPAASSAAGATTGKTGKAGKAGKAARAKGNFVVRGMNNVFDARGALEERQNTQPNFVVKVTSTQPQVFYCAQAQHCQVGMVGVINPSANVSNPCI